MKKICIVLLGAMVLVTMMALAPSAVMGADITITWATPGGPGQPLWNARERYAVSQFEAKYPNAKVELSSRARGDSLMVDIAAGHGPDIFWLVGEDLGLMIRQGIVIPLNEYMDRFDFPWDDVWPGMVDSYHEDGKYYGVPRDVDPFIMYYNSWHFREAGLPDPVVEYDAGNWTTDAYLVALRALTIDRTGDGLPDQAGLNFNAWFPWVRDWMRHAFGVYEFQNPTKAAVAELQWINPYWIEGIQWLADIRLDILKAHSPGSFDAGVVSTETYGTWMIPGWTERCAFEWDIVRHPSHPERQPIICGGGTAYGITSQSEHPELAFALLMEWLSVEQQTAMLRVQMPVRPSVVLSEAFLHLPPRNRRVAAEQLMESVPTKPHLRWSEIERIVQAELAQVWEGEIPARIAGERAYNLAQAISD